MLGEGSSDYRGKESWGLGQSNEQLRKQPFPINLTNLYLVTLQDLVIIVGPSMFSFSRGVPSRLLPTA